MTDDVDVLNFHLPAGTTSDEFTVIRNLAQEVAEAMIRKVKLERELVEAGEPPWVVWKPRGKFTCKALKQLKHE
jgi:hypothetical protein